MTARRSTAEREIRRKHSKTKPHLENTIRLHQENWKILNLPFLPFLACGKSKKYTFSK
jgi:hypothetical protein